LYYVYIAYNPQNQITHIGLTLDMKRRLKLLCINTSQSCRIVYYEEYDDSKIADRRETELLQMPKELIAELVREYNPMLIDLLKTDIN